MSYYSGFVFPFGRDLRNLMMQDSEWEGDGIGKSVKEEENGCTRVPRGAMSVPQGGFC